MKCRLGTRFICQAFPQDHRGNVRVTTHFARKQTAYLALSCKYKVPILGHKSQGRRPRHIMSRQSCREGEATGHLPAPGHARRASRCLGIHRLPGRRRGRAAQWHTRAGTARLPASRMGRLARKPLGWRGDARGRRRLRWGLNPRIFCDTFVVSFLSCSCYKQYLSIRALCQTHGWQGRGAPHTSTTCSAVPPSTPSVRPALCWVSCRHFTPTQKVLCTKGR